MGMRGTEDLPHQATTCRNVGGKLSRTGYLGQAVGSRYIMTEGAVRLLIHHRTHLPAWPQLVPPLL